MRSFLFVPGDDERKLAKAASSGADAVISRSLVFVGLNGGNWIVEFRTHG